MSSGTPTAFLLWAILACLFFAFLCLHLWSYDRFQCLRWNASRQPGNFKRIMTYCYFGELPLLVLYNVATTVLKYREGYLLLGSDVFPKPQTLWSSTHQAWIVPLNIVMALIWTLEFIVHLEELTFWLFLTHQGPNHRDWFESWEFKIWEYGSFLAAAALPTIAIATRRDLISGDAWIFLVGSSAAFITTVCFLHVLYRFPSFLRAVKIGGADHDVLNRLTSFYHLNLVRVVFRFLFTGPILVLAIDTLRGSSDIVLQFAHILPQGGSATASSTLPNGYLALDTTADAMFDGFRSRHPILSSGSLTDFLLMVAGIGCFVSSAITLVIFFPINHDSLATAPAVTGTVLAPPSPYTSQAHYYGYPTFASYAAPNGGVPLYTASAHPLTRSRSSPPLLRTTGLGGSDTYMDTDYAYALTLPPSPGSVAEDALQAKGIEGCKDGGPEHGAWTMLALDSSLQTPGSSGSSSAPLSLAHGAPPALAPPPMPSLPPSVARVRARYAGRDEEEAPVYVARVVGQEAAGDAAGAAHRPLARAQFVLSDPGGGAERVSQTGGLDGQGVHPYVAHFRSPIDLWDPDDNQMVGQPVSPASRPGGADLPVAWAV